MKCAYYVNSRCNSCELLNTSYAETLRLKEEKLKALFPELGTLMKPSVGLGVVQGSRSKSKLAASATDELTFGIVNSTGGFTELENCPLHDEVLNKLLPDLKVILKKYSVVPYDLTTKKGELKYIIASNSADGMLLRFILRSKESLDRLRIAVPELTALPFKIKVVTANIQPEHKAVLEGDEEIILSKDSIIEHKFDEFSLFLGARSFFQVTPEIAKELYRSLSKLIAVDKPSSLIDLYCGVGAFSFYASKNCSDVTGVEISKEAIESAKAANVKNKTNIEFIAQDAELFLKETKKAFEAVLVNPPRRGLNSTIIKNIKAMNPEFIYYSSCNPLTLERDFLELCDQYEARSLQIFDMFPYTEHFEVLMSMKRK